MINLNKLLTCVLLLTKDHTVDKISHLFSIYSTNNSTTPEIKKPALRQMFDHLFFALIYAIPNLAYHEEVGFGFGTEKCERIMEHKLQMQKKVYNEKQNLLKAVLAVHTTNQLLTKEEFRAGVLKYNLLNTRLMRERLTAVITCVESRISKY